MSLQLPVTLTLPPTLALIPAPILSYCQHTFTVQNLVFQQHITLQPSGSTDEFGSFG